MAPSFLWIATVSGPKFRLFLSFAPEKAQEERREVEQQFGDSKKPEDALKVDLARLNEYLRDESESLFVAIRMVDDYQESERSEARNVVPQELLRPRRVEPPQKVKS